MNTYQIKRMHDAISSARMLSIEADRLDKRALKALKLERSGKLPEGHVSSADLANCAACTRGAANAYAKSAAHIVKAG
jgi:hypothetical protein